MPLVKVITVSNVFTQDDKEKKGKLTTGIKAQRGKVSKET